jgi:transcriptional regulator with XRE-family HTH domain
MKLTRNRLTLYRKRRLISRKEVARLLGHVRTDQIMRYEAGTRMPTLEIAVKLSLIYGKPINVLFEEFFEQCLNDVRVRVTVKRLNIAIGEQLSSELTRDIQGRLCERKLNK